MPLFRLSISIKRPWKSLFETKIRTSGLHQKFLPLTRNTTRLQGLCEEVPIEVEDPGARRSDPVEEELDGRGVGGTLTEEK